MTALSADREVSYQPGKLVWFPLKANAVIYKNAAVCIEASSGYLVPGADTAGLIFVGWAYEAADNTGGANGAKGVRVRTEDILPMDCAGASQAWVGQICYLSDDQTVVITGSTNSIRCGVVVTFVSATEVWVKPMGPASISEELEWPGASAAAPSPHWLGDADTGLFHKAANTWGFAAGGAEIGNWSTTDLTLLTNLVLPVGAAATPSAYFTGDSDTGFFHNAANVIGFAAGGAEVGNWSGTLLTLATNLLLPVGAAATPSLYFSGDPDSGFFWKGANDLGFAVGGAEVGDWSATALTVLTKADFQGAVDLGNAGTDVIGLEGIFTFAATGTFANSDPTAHVHTEVWVVAVADAGTITLYAANHHPQMKLMAARAVLLQVPDAAGKKISAKFNDGTADMTDAAEFTQGVEAAGAVKSFTPVGGKEVLALTEPLNLIVATDSAVLGTILVIARFEGDKS